MSINTDLNVFPYGDDYDPADHYHRVLFKPNVPIQTRELNQLQAILQDQVEKFGDAVFESGTIVTGCNFNFYGDYPYVKIRDAGGNGLPVVVSSMDSLVLRATNGLEATVISATDGFEATDPDLKTLYVSYRNSSDDNDTHRFAPGQVLTAYDSERSLASVAITNGGLNFSNTDKLVIVPAVVVDVTSGTFAAGDYVGQPSIGSNLQIVSVDSTSMALQGKVVLSLRPRIVDLANSSVSVSAWSVINSSPIRNAGNTAVGTVEAVLGSGARGGVVTDSTGRVTGVSLEATGEGFSSSPYVTIRSANNQAGITALNMQGVNNRGKVTVASGAASVGNGYAFGVTEGVIYQKGHFIGVDPQTVLVEKYSNSPNSVSVFFRTRESIVDSNEDPSLNDPLAGKSYQAPGADRLRLTAELDVLPTEAIDPDSGLFSLVEFSDGHPTRINQFSSYSALGEEMERRTYEATGDYSVDRFQVTTSSPSVQADEATKIDVVVDPGTAYISGKRVSTQRNYVVSVPKVSGRKTYAAKTSASYGGYIRVTEVGGKIMFNSGDQVTLYSGAKQFLTGYPTTLAPAGTALGTARVRSVTLSSGAPGTPAAAYDVFLFDIRMNTGKNFRDVRSYFYNGTNKGVGDIVLRSGSAVVNDPARSRLIFPIGVESLKNANNATFTYRTDFQGSSFANTGVLTRSLAASPGDSFTSVGPLTPDQLLNILVVPLVDMKPSNTLAGSVAANSTSTAVSGSGTSFLTSLTTGDFVLISNSTGGNCVRRVVSVQNNTRIVVSSNSAVVGSSLSINRYFPNNVPIPFGARAGLTGSVDSGGTVLTLSLGMSINSAASSNASLCYDVVRSNVGPGTKTPFRDRFVRIAVGNNAGNTVGPWCVGMPDVIRLRAVYRGNSSVLTTSSQNVTRDFYIDANHTPDFRDLGWLTQRPASSLSLLPTDHLLVQFDYLRDTLVTGFMCTPSYVSSNQALVTEVDSRSVANLGAQVSTYEVPEVYGADGATYDLLNCLDFRPAVQNTASPSSSFAGAPVNPSAAISFGNTADPANEKLFPRPGSIVTYTAEAYTGRTDSIVMSDDGRVSVMLGVHNISPAKRLPPVAPTGTMLLNQVRVPAYPVLPTKMSAALREVVNTRVINEVTGFYRNGKRTATQELDGGQLDLNQPRQYRMRDIQSIDNRVSALEQYVSLSLLEGRVKDMVIPSSVDPTQNRFKFGFFADDYVGNSLLQLDNPQNSAVVEDGRLVPAKVWWGVDAFLDPGTLPPYAERPVTSQTYATGSANTGCIPVGATFSNAVSYQRQADPREVGKSNDPAAYNAQGTFQFTAANTAGTITLYYQNYDAPARLTVFRGNTQFKDLSDSQAITSQEVSMLESESYNEWFKNQMKSSRKQVTPLYYTGPGKISWTHNPSLGGNYTVIVGKGTNSFQWRYAVSYPIDASAGSCLTLPAKGTKAPSSYRGTITITEESISSALSPRRQLTQEDDDNDGVITVAEWSNSILYDRALLVTATGLKPNTRHDFHIGGVRVDTETVRLNGVVVNGATKLVTTAEGTLTFTFLVRAEMAAVLADVASQAGDSRIAVLSAPNSRAETVTKGVPVKRLVELVKRV